MKQIIFVLCFISALADISYSQNFSFAKQVGGPGDETGFAIAIDGANNQYITGFFNGTSDFDPGPGTYNLISGGGQDIYVLKLDAAGNFIWAKNMGGLGNEFGRSIAVDASGNVIISGSFNGAVDLDPGAGVANHNSAGGFDFFVCKLNTAGNYVWSKTFGDWDNEDHAKAMILDATGNVYVTGSFMRSVDFDPGAAAFVLTSDYIDAFLLKLDGGGNFVWAKKFGGIFTDDGRAIFIDPAGSIFLGGGFRGLNADFDPGPGQFLLNTFGDSDAFICKLDASGNFIWAKQFTTGALNFSTCEGIAVDGSGSIFLTGGFKGTADFNPGAGVFNIAANGYTDGFICKLNSAGDFQWAKPLGGCALEDYGYAIGLDAAGNVYTSGRFMFNTDFDPGPGVYFVSSHGNNDMFIAKFSSAGNIIWAKDLGGGADDYVYSLVVDPLGNTYTTGHFSSWMDADPGTGAFNFTAVGGLDVVVQKMESGLAAPLPVKFDKVKAYQHNSGIQVEWSNMTEQNVVEYIVERAGDSQPFTVVKQLPAAKNNGGRADYYFFDAAPLNGNNIYRIKSIETTGKIEYSLVVRVNINGGKADITVYPNPVRNKQLSLETSGLEKGIYTLNIYNAAGQEIYTRQMNLNGGAVTEMINLPATVKPGIYHVRVKKNEFVMTRTLVVE